MMVAIHQPHYFPWLGYMAKMASVDKFILMDTVQLEKRSYMLRNRIVDPGGHVRYLTVSCEKHNHYEREYRDFRTKDFGEWTSRQKGIIIMAYKKCSYFDEVWSRISPVFTEEHELLCDITIHSVNILREIFEIHTPMIRQSDLKVDSGLKKDKLIIGLCKAAGADIYYAGRGASMQYLDVEECEKEGVHIIYQDFRHPVYRQIGNHPFVQGLSSLDMLFNNGIEKSREIFWASVSRRDKNVGRV